MFYRLQRLLKALGWRSWERYRVAQAWQRHREDFCGGRLSFFRQELALLREPILVPESRGQPGFLQLPEGRPFYVHGRPLDRCLARLCPESSKVNHYRSGLTILLERTAWANPYHNAQDLYDAFLWSRFLGYPRQQTSILWLDDFPPSPYQGLWQEMFAETTHLANIGPTRCERLALGRVNEYSLLSQCLGPRPPWFAEFVASLPGQPGRGRSITLVSREKAKERRLWNRSELYDALRSRYCQVGCVVLEDLSIAEQIEVANTSKVLLGMHGAGLTSILFLPPDAVVLEMFPDLFHCFRFPYRNLARWRGLEYRAILARSAQAPVSRVLALVDSLHTRSARG